MPAEQTIIVHVHRTARIIVDRFDAYGCRFVRLRPQERRPGRHEWHLSAPATMLEPNTARALVPALLEMAAAIDGYSPEAAQGPTNEQKEPA